MRLLILMALCVAAGCSGSAQPDPDGAGSGPGPSDGQSPSTGGPGTSPDGPGPSQELGAGRSGPRRLTQREYANTIRALLGDVLTEADVQELPADATTPFDNDFSTQEQWQQVVLAAERLAERASERALADPQRRSQLVGCTPQGAADAECLRAFIQRFGRQALRRPLSASELDTLDDALQAASEANDFHAAVDVVIRALLQDTEFLYRVERGTPDPEHPGVLRLTDFEVASRLAYFLWQAPPDEALLDQAAAGKLRTPEQVRAAAQRMLSDPRAAEAIQRFHALWLSYEVLPQSAELASRLRTETRALVQRVLLDEQRPWLDLFRSNETYVDALLAEHYGLASPPAGTSKWVPYGTSGRRGILSHGAVLSNGAHYGDTSPTLRGKFVQSRLFCTDIPKPDPATLPPGVVLDKPPTSSTTNCKVERYAAHSEVGLCAGCHQLMDPIGFGLENYDGSGRFRTMEPKSAGSNSDLPACQTPIAGNGEIPGVGTFHGPSELTELLLGGERLDACAATQLYRFAMGRREAGQDRPYLDRVIAAFRGSGHRFDELILALVSDPAFSRRLAQ
ncbi:MAG: DUF1592 domain-containing protein [Myxococcaceae bacterium]|nr:DUF1592 domain-containing protein [Myxococcaceae bacterium]